MPVPPRQPCTLGASGSLRGAANARLARLMQQRKQQDKKTNHEKFL